MKKRTANIPGVHIEATPRAKPQRYQRLAELYGMNICAEPLVVLQRGAILQDLIAQCRVLQLKIENCSDVTLRSAYLKVYCCDDAGDMIPGGELSATYLDINCPPGECFGTKQLLPLPSGIVRTVAIEIDKLVAADAAVYRGQAGKEHFWVKEPEALDSLPIAIQEKENMRFKPEAIADGWWRCACGGLSRQGQHCKNCGRTLEGAVAELDAQIKEIKRQREAAAQQEEERKIRAKKRARNWKIIGVVIGALVLIFLIGCLINDVIIPQYYTPWKAYREAEALLEAGDYYGARSSFARLGDYKDSRDRVDEACYKQAEEWLANGNYPAAISNFDRLSSHSYGGAASRALEARYQYAAVMQADEDYSGAINVYKELGNYEDSTERLNALYPIAYTKAEELLAAEDFRNAISYFEALGNYEDSYKRCEDVRQLAYTRATELQVEGKSGAAAILFGVAGDYTDAHTRSMNLWNEIAVRDTICVYDGQVIYVKQDGTVGLYNPGYSDESLSNIISGWRGIIAISYDNGLIGLTADGTTKFAFDNPDGWIEIEEETETDIVAISGSYSLKCDGTVAGTEWTDIVAIADYHIGLKADGTVVGSDSCKSWTDIVAISAKGDRIVGLKKNGTVVATGYDEDTLRDMQDWTDIVAISDAVGLKSDGTIVTAGNDEYGRSNLTDIVALSGEGIAINSQSTVYVPASNISGYWLNEIELQDMKVESRDANLRTKDINKDTKSTATFYDVLSTYDNQNSTHIAYADLEDMDGDGVSEMILVTEKLNDQPNGTVHVWQLRNGVATEVTSVEVYTSQLTSISYTTQEDKKYLALWTGRMGSGGIENRWTYIGVDGFCEQLYSNCSVEDYGEMRGDENFKEFREFEHTINDCTESITEEEFGMYQAQYQIVEELSSDPTGSWAWYSEAGNHPSYEALRVELATQ